MLEIGISGRLATATLESTALKYTAMGLNVFQLPVTATDAVTVKAGVGGHDSGGPTETPVRSQKEHAVVEGKQLRPGAFPQRRRNVIVGAAERVNCGEHAQKTSFNQSAIRAMAQQDLNGTAANAPH